MARDVLRFVDALALKQIDVLGFSLGGYALNDSARRAPSERKRMLRKAVARGDADAREVFAADSSRQRARGADQGIHGCDGRTSGALSSCTYN